MASKSFTIIALMILITSLRRTTCMSMRKSCQTHDDCSSMWICDSGMCRLVKSFAEFEETIQMPCKLVFKTPCKVDAECHCNSASMICESNECVVRRDENMAFERRRK
eukprot:Seg1849.2 transcript_id=Seg1849.2/GoldUCD/mRNA.D3Y31 product="hypothetical protein" protein_id=Seg1849.2/GoldUCD/D3Y31